MVESGNADTFEKKIREAVKNQEQHQMRFPILKERILEEMSTEKICKQYRYVFEQLRE